jgi:hypothetical protein
VTQKPPDLHLVDEPEAPAPSNVIHISGIRSHAGVVDPRSVAPPWPRNHSWRDLMDRLAKKRATTTKDPAR